MKELFRYFNQDIKMRNKLIVSFAIIAVTPIILISVLLSWQYSNKIMNQIYQITKGDYDQMYVNISNFYENYARIGETLLDDDVLMEYLYKTYPENTSYTDKYYDCYAVHKACVDKYGILQSGELKIKVYTSNRDILVDNDMFGYIEPEIETKQWYINAVRANGRMVLNVDDTADEATGKSRYIISRRLNYREKGKTDTIAVMAIELREDSLFAMINEQNDKKQIYLLDCENRVITSNIREHIGLSPDKVFSDENIITKLASDDARGELKEKEQMVYIRDFELNRNNGFGTIVVVIPTAYLRSQMYAINGIAYAITIVILLMSLIFLIFLSKSITARLSKLAEVMSGMDMEKLDYAETGVLGRDEIGQLSHSFEEMLRKLSALIDEKYEMAIKIQETELNRNKAELHALQSQINPHFLYNIMGSVSVSLLENGDRKNASMLRKYANLLRKSAEWGDDNVTVNQELVLVEDYLSIQKCRFEDRFDYSIKVCPEHRQLIIPKYTLIPLVENAFEHGIGNIAHGGMVEIFSYEENDCVKIVVKDNGDGIPADKLAELTALMESHEYHKKARIGIQNVNRRLTMLNGDEFGLKLISENGQGTESVVAIPKSDNH